MDCVFVFFVIGLYNKQPAAKPIQLKNPHRATVSEPQVGFFLGFFWGLFMALLTGQLQRRQRKAPGRDSKP